MRLGILLTLLALLGPIAHPAAAAESAPVSTARDSVTLVTDTDAVAADNAFQAGLRFRLAPGWHIYWHNPGDAGAPPAMHLSLPAGITASGFAWPTPQRLPDGPLMSYGYTGEVLLPFTLSPGAAAAPSIAAKGLSIEAKVDWLVCEKICVPEQGVFRLHLPPGAPSPSAQTALFARAAAALPRMLSWPAHIGPDGRLGLTDPAISPATVAGAWFFPARQDVIVPAAAQTLRVGEGALTLALQRGKDFAADAPLAGVLVLRDPGGQESAWQISAAPGPVRTPHESGAPKLTLVQMLAFAFLGGIILNLMPCVFPVLAMKALGLVGLSGQARGAVRAHAVSYTGGILLAFAALAGILLGLRTVGAAAGWGFQFQSPVFVAAMAWLLFGVGLNLSGVFAVGGSLAGAGQGLAGRGGHLGSFFTGLLAVLVATPCTAPFMGAAIAAAMAAPPLLMLAVFLAMGLGLAAPYGLLAAFPQAAHLLPAPGRWMDVLRQGLAFPMYAAAVWLLWVISREAGSAGVLGASAGMLFLGFAGWAIGQAQHAAVPGRRLGRSAALAAVLAALAVLPGIASAPVPSMRALAQGDSLPGFESFSAARLGILHQQGRPVFIDMTAAWCVTCLVNERVALSSPAVRGTFAAHRIVYMQGDWTRQDPEITRFLRQFGHPGVPLYVLFPPDDAAPVVLPQILTEGIVLDAMKDLPLPREAAADPYNQPAK